MLSLARASSGECIGQVWVQPAAVTIDTCLASSCSLWLSVSPPCPYHAVQLSTPHPLPFSHAAALTWPLLTAKRLGMSCMTFSTKPTSSTPLSTHTPMEHCQKRVLKNCRGMGTGAGEGAAHGDAAVLFAGVRTAQQHSVFTATADSSWLTCAHACGQPDSAGARRYYI